MYLVEQAERRLHTPAEQRQEQIEHRQRTPPFAPRETPIAGGTESNPGLGLSIVHGIITEMGGRISVESTPGECTRFTICLPVSPPQEAKP